MFLPIRNKIFISFSLLALITVTVSFAVVYNVVKQDIEQRITDELKNSTELIHLLVESTTTSSIQNYLRAITETQIDTIREIYEQYQDGAFSEEEAKKLAENFLLHQKIGSSGYIYCIDSHGVVQVHQDQFLVGQDVSEFKFVQDQLWLKAGYLEYSWKNTGEKRAREKALYMGYFPAWDWIVSVSAYKNEFAYLIDFSQIRGPLDKVTFGKTGYPFIFNGSGDLLYHPRTEGNFYTSGFEQRFIDAVDRIIAQKQGTLYYDWKNPGEINAREKIALFNYLPDFDWYVGTSAYIEELYQPLENVKKIFLLSMVLVVFGSILASYWLSRVITRPLMALVRHFTNRKPSEIEFIDKAYGQDEIGMLGDCLNQFIGELQDYHQQLTAEISERKFSEDALRTSERTFDSLFNNSFQFIALLDPVGRVFKVNQTALKFRNLKPEDVVGLFFWDTPWWQHSASMVAQLKEAFSKAQRGQIARFEVTSTSIREICLDISLKPIKNSTGENVFIIAEARDVTEIRRAERDLQQAQKMESVGTLAGGIAHDFNNALAGILGVVSLLEIKRENGKEISEDLFFKHLGLISSSALRAKDIVNQLLTLSRKYDFEMKPVDLRRILEQVCQIAGNSFDKSIQINVDLSCEIAVVADSNSLEQVFLNLFINAAHAMTIMRKKDMPWGGSIDVGVKQLCLLNNPHDEVEAYWCINIKDSGIGIKQDYLEKVFEPFFTTKEKGVGSGMGMAMVYHIVKQHNGFIEIDSEYGLGTQVRVYLPVSGHQQKEQVIAAEEEIIRGQGTILVIDDEELVRLSAEAQLQECGYQVLLAENGAQGIDFYRENLQRIDLILLDLVMPVMSGKEAFERLKGINPDVKVLLSSGFKQDLRVADILEGGASGFIQKPYSLSSLSQKVSDALGD